MATLLLLAVMWLLGDESNSDLANPLVMGRMTFFALCLVPGNASCQPAHPS